MIYFRQVEGIKGYHFMWPLGTIFMGATATFDETLFPCCKNSKPKGTRFGDLPPPSDQGNHNTPGTSNEEDDDDQNDQDVS